MLEEVCAEIRNYFVYRDGILIGDYTITDGVISPSVDFKGAEYIRIVGSRKNNGVHKLADNDLEDEDKFHGSVWLMYPPKDFMTLIDDISKWTTKYMSADSLALSPFNSESFSGYAYSKAGSSGAVDGSGGGTISWQNTFASRLKKYRRIRVL